MRDRSLVRLTYRELDEARKRIVTLLPYVGKADEGTQLALAYVTMSYGMDPFAGDVWAIAKKVDGKFVGWGLMFGIRGLRKVAFRSGQYDGHSFRSLREDEAALLGLDVAKGWTAIACEVRRRDCSEPFVGYGLVFENDKSRMNHGQLALLRAERHALRRAFPVEVWSLVLGRPEGFEVVEGVEDVLEEDVVELQVEQLVDLGPEAGEEGAAQAAVDLFGEEA